MAILARIGGGGGGGGGGVDEDEDSTGEDGKGEGESGIEEGELGGRLSVCKVGEGGVIIGAIVATFWGVLEAAHLEERVGEEELEFEGGEDEGGKGS